MTRDWGLFWLALAVMGFAGAITANAAWGQPFDVGSLGQWASAVGTVTAVTVALWNTRTTLEATEARESRKQAASDAIYLQSVGYLGDTVEAALKGAQEMLADPGVDSSRAKEIALNTNLEGLAGAADRIPIHTSPAPLAIITLVALRTAVINSAHLINTWAADTAKPKPDLADEIDLVEHADRKFGSWLTSQ